MKYQKQIAVTLIIAGFASFFPHFSEAETKNDTAFENVGQPVYSNSTSVVVADAPESAATLVMADSRSCATFMPASGGLLFGSFADLFSGQCGAITIADQPIAQQALALKPYTPTHTIIVLQQQDRYEKHATVTEFPAQTDSGILTSVHDIMPGVQKQKSALNVFVSETQFLLNQQSILRTTALSELQVFRC